MLPDPCDETNGFVDEACNIDLFYHDNSEAFTTVFHTIFIAKMVRCR